MKRLSLILALTALLLTSAAFADGTVDGIIGGGYGAAVATDATSSPEGVAGGTYFDHLDLANLYITQDATRVYIAVEVVGDTVATNWGKYCMFIATDNGAFQAGASDGNGWGRPLAADGVNLTPTYWIGSWVDAADGAQLWEWDGAAWNVTATGASAELDIANSAGVVEFGIDKTLLNSPAWVEVEALSTGGGGTDPAIDTIPSDINGDWGDTGQVLDAPSPAVAVPVELSVFSTD
jgi:hypothetical protein